MSVPPQRDELAGHRTVLERVLLENLVPFWYPSTIDPSEGGFRLNHDARGRWRGPAPKRLVTQSRMLWFLSRLAGTRYGGPEHLAAARNGFAFLRERMWDEQYGGFYWEVDAGGRSATLPGKHLYGQAAALYAMSAYAGASADREAHALARELVALLERQAYDARFGGYIESFDRAWAATPRDGPKYTGQPGAAKSMNTHLHLMEAMSEYVRIIGDPAAHARLFELILVQSNAVLRKRIGACSDAYHPDWTPLHDGLRVSFGHDLENVRLLGDACSAAGISDRPLLDLYRTIFDYALRFGWDRRHGGFFESGPPNTVADRRTKIWWVQAEALLAALTMWMRTGEPRYRECFVGTLRWIVRRQADWKYGEWHAEIGRFRSRSAPKADGWKGPMHTGRAVITCLEMLA